MTYEAVTKIKTGNEVLISIKVKMEIISTKRINIMYLLPVKNFLIFID